MDTSKTGGALRNTLFLFITCAVMLAITVLNHIIGNHISALFTAACFGWCLAFSIFMYKAEKARREAE